MTRFIHAIVILDQKAALSAAGGLGPDVFRKMEPFGNLGGKAHINHA
jgi:hypothetical protein